MRMDDNADAERILLAFPPADWRRQLGRPRITWLSTVQQDLKQHHLTLPEAADLAQNRPLWRMITTYGATQSRVACQERRRRRMSTFIRQQKQHNTITKSYWILPRNKKCHGSNTCCLKLSSVAFLILLWEYSKQYIHLYCCREHGKKCGSLRLWTDDIL